MIRAVADTHAVLWYLYNDARLSVVARTWIEGAVEAGEQIALSTITLAEMVYLVEKGRIDSAALSRLAAALDESGAVLVEVPIDRHIVQAMTRVPRADVPDLPDRIIAATALYLGVPLVSRDGKIQASDLGAMW